MHLMHKFRAVRNAVRHSPSGTGLDRMDVSPASVAVLAMACREPCGGGVAPSAKGEGGFSSVRELRIGENTDRRAVTCATALHSMPKVCALGLRAAARMPGHQRNQRGIATKKGEGVEKGREGGTKERLTSARQKEHLADTTESVTYPQQWTADGPVPLTGRA
jgi:hypothetical protein